MAIETPSVHEQAAAALLDPYLHRDPPDGWHLIDNADADDVRHALEVAIERMRAVLKRCSNAGYIPLPGDDGCSGRMIDADVTSRTLQGKWSPWTTQ